MFALSIDREMERFMELEVIFLKRQVVGNVLADAHAIRYTMKSRKGAIPKHIINNVDIFSDENGKFLVEIYTKGDESWNASMRRCHPILYWLKIIKRSTSGKVSLGYFECQADANRFKDFLKKLEYPFDVPFKEAKSSGGSEK